MRLRTFTAPDIPSAMKMVREALGDNAVILATDTKSHRGQVTLTAAIEEERVHGLGGRVQEDLAEARDPKPEALITEIKLELQNILRFHNIPEMFVARLLQRTSDKDFIEVIENRRGSEELFRPALIKLLSRNFVFDPIRFSTQDLRLMLIGAAGIGKTLTIAKLATKLAMDKQSLAVITTDTNRAGGIEQLQAFTSILDIELQVANNVGELQNILKSLPSRTRVLVDTAGCSPYDYHEFNELKSIAKTSGIEPILVLPAGGDSLETIDNVELFMELPIRRVLITKSEATRRFGGIISAIASHGLSLCNVSRNASITDFVQPLEPAILAQMLLKYKL